MGLGGESAGDEWMNARGGLAHWSATLARTIAHRFMELEEITDEDLREDEEECPGTIEAFHSKCSA